MKTIFYNTTGIPLSQGEKVQKIKSNDKTYESVCSLIDALDIDLSLHISEDFSAEIKAMGENLGAVLHRIENETKQLYREINQEQNILDNIERLKKKGKDYEWEIEQLPCYQKR